MDALGILPAPVTVRPAPGHPFLLTPDVRVVVGEEPDAVAVAVLVAARIGHLTEVPVAVVHTDDGAPGSIVLRLLGGQDVPSALTTLGADPALPDGLAAEAYRLTVDEHRVEVVALSAAGLVRAAASLLQMAVPAAPWPYVRGGTVVDHPRLAWRGLLVDVSDHPLALPDAQALVNVMATVKLNVLHIRVADTVAWLPDFLDEAGEVAGAFAELQAYATARQIAVVPEIDVAGEALPDARTAEVLGRVAATTRAHVVHVGGRPAAADEVGRGCGERIGRAADDVAAAGAVVMAWQCAASALGAGGHLGHLLQVRDVADPALGPAVAQGAVLVLSPPVLDLGDRAVSLRERWEADPLALAGAAGLPREAVRGVEVVLGGVHGGTREGLFAALLPDLAAVAEAAWSGAGATSWSSFAARLAAERARWAHLGLPVPPDAD
ncbi:MAG: family 20 glycosylhydrolase [Actinotalea sp.]|nr:family 20 glycosylhydrolase [Actinotalea sp.]